MTAALQGSLMVDVAGTWLTAEDRHLLRQPEVGGLIIFARNIEHPRQVRELSAAIRAVRPDLLLAVDQEGGRVQRLRQGFVRLPAMRALAGHPNAEYLAEQCGWIMATEVLAVGLDLSFAPVLDLDYQRSAVVGTRSVEGDPERAAVLAGAHVVGDAASRIEAALSAGCDMGLVCNDRAAAELALSAAQRMKVTPSARIARMRGQAIASTDYKQDPRWLAALGALRDAQLIE